MASTTQLLYSTHGGAIPVNIIFRCQMLIGSKLHVANP